MEGKKPKHKIDYKGGCSSYSNQWSTTEFVGRLKDKYCFNEEFNLSDHIDHVFLNYYASAGSFRADEQSQGRPKDPTQKETITRLQSIESAFSELHTMLESLTLSETWLISKGLLNWNKFKSNSLSNISGYCDIADITSDLTQVLMLTRMATLREFNANSDETKKGRAKKSLERTVLNGLFKIYEEGTKKTVKVHRPDNINYRGNIMDFCNEIFTKAQLKSHFSKNFIGDYVNEYKNTTNK